ncbi:MAG: phosphatidylinositol-specific phospholipase C domain-containing protein [Candidatus Dadabacteria bacterium]|nr:MAG: phosphatidylinositol-specific phospholipase C domain-containing protein [Candidatus Dadabacteria bacterium]
MPVMRDSVIRAIFLLLAMSTAACDSAAVPDTCNGSALLCERPLNQVTLAGTHNSMSNEAEGWQLPNQHFGIERQLADGIRKLGLDIWLDQDELMLCHGLCQLGSRPLTDALQAIAQFMELQRDAIILIDIEDNADGAAERIVAAFEEAGLARFARPMMPGDPWPTLGQMVRDNKRLLVFGTPVEGVPWMLPYKEFVWVTDYATPTTESLTCEARDGFEQNPALLFDLHHSLVDPFPSPESAAIINAGDFLRYRIARCERETGQRVNMISVDFHDIGDLIEVVNEHNGVTTPVSE